MISLNSNCIIVATTFVAIIILIHCQLAPVVVREYRWWSRHEGNLP
jgi:hypothetical protein